jgi:lysophospholipase L1-like esterase
MKILVVLFLLFAGLPIVAQQTTDCLDAQKKLAEAQQRLNDWAELARYRDANSSVTAPAKGDNRVVFIGDSITDLWDNEGFGGFFPGKPYIDRGIGGQTTPQLLVRFHQDVIALRPKVVVILAGTNDIAGNTGPMTLAQTADAITSMADLATANGIKVVLSSVLPVSDTVRRDNGELYIQTKARPPAKIVAMNDWLRSFADRSGYTYLDYYSAMVDSNGFVKDGITFDGLHPNAKGYAIMTPLVEQAIQRALKSKK